MVDAIGIIKDPSRLRELFGASATLINDIRVDIMVEETPIYEWEIPQQRVDIGTDIADSRYKKPVGVTLDCEFLDPEYSLSNAIGSAIGGAEFSEDDWRTKRDKLMQLADKNEVITIVTPSNFDYSDMMITAIQPTINTRTATYFAFRLIARRIEFVNSEITAIDQNLLPDELKKKKDVQSETKQDPPRNNGRRNTVPARKKNKSILKSLYDKASKLIKKWRL